MIFDEDTYDEINAELRELAARQDEEENDLIHVGSGEDCQFVLFAANYKPLRGLDVQLN